MSHRLLGILLFSFSLLVAWLMMDFHHFADAPLELPEEGFLYTLEPGSSVAKLAANLERNKILKNALYLRLLARWEGQASRLQAGEYQIAAGTTPRMLLNQVVAGKVVSHALTLVEGWTFRQVMEAVGRHGALKHALEGLPDEEIMASAGVNSPWYLRRLKGMVASRSEAALHRALHVVLMCDLDQRTGRADSQTALEAN